MWWLYFKSDILFFFVYHVIGYRKKVVINNLKLVFPQKSTSEINAISKKFFAHFCDIIAETIKSITISEKEIRKRFNVTNIEHLKPYYDANKSILLMAGHYANWEWSGILNRMMDHQAHAVYKPLRNKQMDAVVKKIRQRFGGVIVSNKLVVPMLYRKKKKDVKTLTYILSDQSPKDGHYKHRDTFMNIDVPMFTGAEDLAKKLDFAVLYLHVEKVKRGYYAVTFKTIAEHANTMNDFEITRKFYNLLESQIKEVPHLYLWSHKRWKLRI
ncbi:lipid A biosynthesis protein [Patiriisocius marinistellae]|uniref:Lipid A biosynthesis protein n=2 Tax=Patiriisocius marinistellae TaxID=2494560 RepID=A0A5J4G2X1_9FLAO|nr:lipid A biosynthesis protein [Patiriisocius marinistellae]